MDNSKPINYTLPIKGLSARPWNIQTIYDALKKYRGARQATRNLYMQARQCMTALYECFEEELEKIPTQSLNPNDRKDFLREVNNYNQRLFRWLGAGQDKEELDPAEHESLILEYTFLVTRLRDLQKSAEAGQDDNTITEPTPDTDSSLIYQSDAALFYNIPKSLLSKNATKEPGEPGYLWSGVNGRRRFYRKKDLGKIARSRQKLKGV